MLSSRHCPKCHQPLAADAPEGLCPACLLTAALPGQSAADSGATRVWDSAPGTATIPPSAGMRLRYVGDYELLEEIARGGMGIVWRAKQISLNRTVAVKTVRDGALASPDDVQRFLREAEAAANLQHPNIVAIHEVGEHQGQYYFSMDYVDGRDLAAIRRDGPLPPQQIAKLMQTIADAIHFAHQRGTLHRDLKPQNVLIDAAGQPRITDFGLAKLANEDSRLTQAGVVMGSPSYMPPEQAAGNLAEIGPHSDVYSLGAILYELLTGRPPFQGATPVATLRAVMEADPVAPHKLNADVPPDLETICLKCLEKSSSQRYHSARELADDLARFIKREPILAQRASLVRRATTWLSRHPAAIATLASLVMLGLLFASYFLFERNRFLTAQRENESLVRQVGEETRLLDAWSSLDFIWYMGGVLILFAISINRQRKPWRHALEISTGAALRAPEPMTKSMRIFVNCAGLVYVAFGLAFSTRLIHLYVWEGPVPFRTCFTAFWSVWVGVLFVAGAMRDGRLAYYGRPIRNLTPTQIESIEQALLDETDVIEAIRRYRLAVPETGKEEAKVYVLQLLANLRTRSPDKVRPRRLSLSDLNWQAVLICASVAAALVTIILLAFPALRSDAAFWYDSISGLLTSFSTIPAVIATARAAKVASRIVAGMLIGPAYLVATILRPHFIEGAARGESSFTFWFACGAGLGACLIVSALTRRRKS